MIFFTIDPSNGRMETVSGDEPRDAVKAIGLDPMAIDHGVLWPGFSVIVYEFGLLEKQFKDFWCIEKGRLHAGKAVCYSYDHAGETINTRDEDMERATKGIAFFNSRGAVERAIRNNLAQRPQTSINGVVLWKWQP